MTSRRWTRRSAIALVAAIPLLLAGCGMFKADETGGQIDPPQVEYETEAELDAELLDQEVTALPEKEAPVTLYFKDADGYVAPLGIRIPAEPGIAKLALAYMVEGGPAESVLPDGFTALLPKGTKVLGMDIRQDGLAIVDFSEQFTDYNSEDERKIMEAVTWTLTGFNSVSSVQLWVEGKPLKEMPKDATPLDDPLTRDMGINLELEEGVNPALASAVTVYFKSQTSDTSYYVPVTRLIRHADNMTLAAMQELVEGPAANSGLHGVLPESTEVLGVELKDDTVVVNFGGSIHDDASYPVDNDALQAVILSLTEQTHKTKVQIMVDGKAGVMVGETKQFASPVTRPLQVNPVTL